jgi:hypothetical protein
MGQESLNLVQDMLFDIGFAFRDAGSTMGQDFKSHLHFPFNSTNT